MTNINWLQELAVSGSANTTVKTQKPVPKYYVSSKIASL